jgi:hypothetical protein
LADEPGLVAPRRHVGVGPLRHVRVLVVKVLGGTSK